MVFVGDIALGELLPPKVELPDSVVNTSWVGNLEGAVASGDLSSSAVFTSPESFAQLASEYDWRCLSLANNHILDLGQEEAASTKKLVETKGIKTIGFGKRGNSNCHQATIHTEGKNISIITAGWSVIGCEIASVEKQGCWDVDKETLLKSVAKARADRNIDFTVVYLHWGIELEIAPQPYHRSLAHQLVAAGASLIIGCHAHRLQGAEMYQGVPIIYGLGNWMFPQNHFWGGRLKYPPVATLQLAVNWDAATGKIAEVLFYEYDANGHALKLTKTGSLKDINPAMGIDSFEGMPPKAYGTYFRKIREKKKLLPVYNATDTKWQRDLKDNWIGIRHTLITSLSYVKKRMR